MAEPTSTHRRLIIRLTLSCVLMFGFGFALVPLYDVFCRVTGINGKVLNTGPLQEAVASDMNRRVKVQLIAVNNAGMPWGFRPSESSIEVYIGEMKQTAYIASNPTDRYMIAQAVPSVAPAEAAQYLQKVNCFCFERQPLDAKEQREMPLLFVLDDELPEHIKTITLSYTLFDITPEDALAAASGSEEVQL